MGIQVDGVSGLGGGGGVGVCSEEGEHCPVNVYAQGADGEDVGADVEFAAVR